MERNASIYQVNPVSRISGKGRAEFFRTWGPDFDQKGGEIYVPIYVNVSVEDIPGSNDGQFQPLLPATYNR